MSHSAGPFSERYVWHAYHIDYGAAAAPYVDAFMDNVNCDECNRRHEEARKIFGMVKQ